MYIATHTRVARKYSESKLDTDQSIIRHYLYVPTCKCISGIPLCTTYVQSRCSEKFITPVRLRTRWKVHTFA